MNKSKKIIIGILIALIIVVGIVVAYKIIENSVINRADFNFTVENISSSPVNTIDHGQNDTELKEAQQKITEGNKITGMTEVTGPGVIITLSDGKGVATSLGVLLLSNWQIGLICLVFALVLMCLTRMVSVGSCAAAVLFPVLTLFINEHYTVLTEGKSGNVYFIYSLILAVIVLFNHRSNIKRILNGTENKISFKK